METVIFQNKEPIFEDLDDISNPTGHQNCQNSTFPPLSFPTMPNKKVKLVSQWTTQENQAYLKFILEHQSELQSQFIRRKTKVFKKLSDQMGGAKTSEQCRGHHKKYIGRYKCVDGIIEALEKKRQRQHLKQAKIRKQEDQKKSQQKKIITQNSLMHPEETSRFFEQSKYNHIVNWLENL